MSAHPEPTAEFSKLLDRYESAVLAYNWDEEGGLGFRAARSEVERYVALIEAVKQSEVEARDRFRESAEYWKAHWEDLIEARDDLLRVIEGRNSEVARLREDALTPEEARYVEDVMLDDPAFTNGITEARMLAKLRRISAPSPNSGESQ